MSDLTRQSDRLIEQGRALRDDNRAGGRHRQGGSIGKGSANLKLRHFGKKIRNILLALLAVVFAAGAIGLVVDGIGFVGVMIAFGVAVLATLVLSKYPRMAVPKREDLMKTDDVRKLVARTELWLETRRGGLPPKAADLVATIGAQLDVLGAQLDEVDQNHPTARQIRKLIAQDLPDMIDGYEKIPDQLRHEERGGSTPAAQLTSGLELISTELGSITRQLADGALDDLAIRTRYLDYKYGEGMAEPQLGGPAQQSGDSGVPLDFSKSETKVARD